MRNKSKNVKTITSNFIWRFMERAGAQIVQFVVSIILARILSPNDYGTVALIVVIANIFQVFVDSGLGNALIQKKDADDMDFSSVFYLNICFCILLYIILFFSAPLVAWFYGNPQLISLTRVLCLTVVISGVKNVQQAYISRTLQFKKFFFATLVGTVSSALIGIYMAYSGYGVWSLVIQRVANLGIGTVMLWITVKWRPQLCFSFRRIKTLFGFGWKLMVSSLIDTVYVNLRQIFIGKLYSEKDLAYYNQGNQYPNVLANMLNTSIDGVIFPVMSQEQNDKIRLKNMARRSIKTATFILAPVMIGIAAVGPNLIHIFLTDKWMPSLPYLRIFCISYMFYPIHTANLTAINAQGRSDIFLKLEIVKKTIGVIVILISLNYGILAIAIGELIVSFLGQIINSWPNKKLLRYSYFEQLSDIFPNIIQALVMGGIVLIFENITPSEIVNLLIQIIIGVLVYIFFSIVTKNETYMYLLNFLKQTFKR